MKKMLRLLMLSCCCLATGQVTAQEPVREPSETRFRGMEGRPERRLAPDERLERREEIRAQRETWRQMSPEERHRLRSDIRDAGRSLYRGRRGGRDMGR